MIECSMKDVIKCVGMDYDLVKRCEIKLNNVLIVNYLPFVRHEFGHYRTVVRSDLAWIRALTYRYNSVTSFGGNFSGSAYIQIMEDQATRVLPEVCSALYLDRHEYRVQIADRHFVKVWYEGGHWVCCYFVLGWNYDYVVF